MKSIRVNRVIDLRDYAASARTTNDWLTGRAEPVFSDHGALVTAFAPNGGGRVTSMPTDEFVMAVSGEIAFRGSGGTAIIGAGRSAVLPAGLSFEWHASGATTAVVMACPTTSVRAMDVVSIDVEASLAPVQPAARGTSRRTDAVRVAIMRISARPAASSSVEPGIRRRTTAARWCTDISS